MTAVDTNILVYAHRQDSPHNEAAASAIKRLAEGMAPLNRSCPRRDAAR